MYSVGVDIGGTNIACGLVDESLRLVSKTSVPFPGPDRPEASIPAMEGAIHTLLAQSGVSPSDAQSIGLAVPGSIDYQSKCVIDAHNLGYHGFPLAALLQPRFPDCRIDIENDANAAALAEYYCGAFSGHSSGLLITIGTGIGGGLILNDRLFIGGMKNGFEFGHAILQFGGEPCSCGNLGCIETYCSATALIREGRRAACAYPRSMITAACGGDGKRVTAKLVLDCAKAGDAAAMEIFQDYVAHLGAAIVSAVVLFDPEVVAIGGGVAAAGEFLLTPVREYVAPRCFFHKFAKIVPAEMGNDAGIIGAAMLFQHRNV